MFLMGVYFNDSIYFEKSIRVLSQSLLVVSFFVAISLSKIIMVFNSKNLFPELVEFLDKIYFNSHIILSSLINRKEALINYPNSNNAYSKTLMYSELISSSAEKSFFQIEKQNEIASLKKEIKPNTNYFISFENVSFVKNTNSILNNISFNLNPMEKIAIVGPSGAGKSSILRLISGLDKPSQGEISVPKETSFRFFTQDPLDSIIGHSPESDMSYYFQDKSSKFLPLVQNSLDSVGLISKKDTLFLQLSPGERRIYNIACLELRPFDCLLLDEPTSGLDRHNQTLFVEKLQKITKTVSVVWVTHDISVVPEDYNRFLFIRDGRLVHDISRLDALAKNLIYFKKQAVINEDFYATK
jgi:ABC-type multidrug transport system ATPase subunit